MFYWLKKKQIFLIFILQTQLGCAAMLDDNVLKFKTHDLNIQCYSVGDVRLEYAGTLYTLFDGKISKEKTAKDATKYPSGKSGSYYAFASPVKIEWRSRDGTRLQHTLNLDEIFKDRRVLHTDDPARIYKPMPITGDEPTIIVELNDRTVNVYMFAVIQLIPVDPNAKQRDEHENRTLAYSKTY